jgi:small subunit ribosomal protein S20
MTAPGEKRDSCVLEVARSRKTGNGIHSALGPIVLNQVFSGFEAEESCRNSPLPLAFGQLHRQNSRLFFGVCSVANIKSAIKRARQTIQRRSANMAARSRLRSAIKNVLSAVEAGKKDEAVTNLKVAVPVIDSMVNKGIIHRNKAARHKSQLNARVKALAG